MDAETWSNSYFGEEITKYVIEPTTNVFYFQSLRDVSRVVPIVTTSLLFRKRARLSTLRGGICELPERLASELDVRLRIPVKSMSVEGTPIEVNFENETILADRVILSTAASVAAGLYKDPSRIERELLSTGYTSTVVIALGVRDSCIFAPEISGLYGVVIPRPERVVISAIANEGNKDRARVGSGKLLLAFMSEKAGSEMIDWRDDDILAVVLNEMEKYFAGISDNISFTKIYRWKEATPLSQPGRSRNVARSRKSVNASIKVFLAGDYMGMPFSEGAAESGKWAARAGDKLSFK
jgi:protoporphyrinogen/coproporphyrinogen III oxidase